MPYEMTLQGIIRLLFGLLILVLPFSVEIQTRRGISLSLPAEPIMGLLAVLLLVQARKDTGRLKSFFRNPIVLVAAAYLLWEGLTLPFSTMPGVSLKYFLVDATHGWIFLGGMLWLMQTQDWKPSFGYRLYLTSFLLIVVYGWYTHAHYDFRMDTSNLAQRPFYFDHTMYSACMALLLPWVITAGLTATGRSEKWILFLAAMVLTVGLYLSFSRATWLSLVLSAVLLLLILSRVRLRIVFAGLLLIGAGIFIFKGPLTDYLNSNRSPSKSGTLTEQVASMANIRGDVSNKERLNRYKCAWRMFLDRPLTGFGAGTFQFQYLPYQRKEEMTRISVTGSGLPQAGRGGGAHSEYLSALSEMGFPGFLCWILLPIFALRAGIKVFRNGEDRQVRLAALGGMLGLSTYFFHGCFNNFFHTGKVAALVWMGLAVLVFLEESHRDLPKENNSD